MMNAPVFYTCMIQDFSGEQHILFIITVCGMVKIGGKKVVVIETDDILVGGIKVNSGSNGISSMIPLLPEFLWATT